MTRAAPRTERRWRGRGLPLALSLVARRAGVPQPCAGGPVARSYVRRQPRWFSARGTSSCFGRPGAGAGPSPRRSCCGSSTTCRRARRRRCCCIGAGTGARCTTRRTSSWLSCSSRTPSTCCSAGRGATPTRSASGPFPVIFSINLFLWFKPDWFYFQFLMVALGFAAKELIRWDKDGRRAHIFNPSSFPLACSRSR